MKSVLLALILLMLTAPAVAEDINIPLRVGEPFELVVFRGSHTAEASAYVPMDWCEISTEEGAVYLTGCAPSAGRWSLDVEVRSYSPGDKKGQPEAEMTLHMLVGTNDADQLYQPDYLYRWDGRGMVETREKVECLRVPGGAVMTVFPERERLIYTGLEEYQGEQWFRVYHHEWGCGAIPAVTANPLYEKPLTCQYTPGEVTTVRLWHTEQRFGDVRLQRHECNDGGMTDHFVTIEPGDRATWHTLLHMTLTGDEPYVMHQIELVALDTQGRPVEVVTVLASPKEN